jgi:hypothetical protein
VYPVVGWCGPGGTSYGGSAPLFVLGSLIVRTYHYETYLQLRRHVADYSWALRASPSNLKAPRWKTPYETIWALYAPKPGPLRHPPHPLTDYLTLGPST